MMEIYGICSDKIHLILARLPKAIWNDIGELERLGHADLSTLAGCDDPCRVVGVLGEWHAGRPRVYGGEVVVSRRYLHLLGDVDLRVAWLLPYQIIRSFSTLGLEEGQSRLLVRTVIAIDAVLVDGVAQLPQEAGALQRAGDVAAAAAAVAVAKQPLLGRRARPGWAGDVPLGRGVLPDPGGLARPDADVGLGPDVAVVGGPGGGMARPTPVPRPLALQPVLLLLLLLLLLLVVEGVVGAGPALPLLLLLALGLLSLEQPQHGGLSRALAAAVKPRGDICRGGGQPRKVLGYFLLDDFSREALGEATVGIFFRFCTFYPRKSHVLVKQCMSRLHLSSKLKERGGERGWYKSEVISYCISKTALSTVP